MSFSVPNKCPQVHNSFCNKKMPSILETIEEHPEELDEEKTDQMEEELNLPSFEQLVEELQSPVTPLEKMQTRISPSTGPWSKELLDQVAKGKKVIDNELTGATVRHSYRQKAQKKGFRTSPCPDKNCLGCSVQPPTISPSVIKNLGSSFCGIEPEKLTEQVPSKKKKVASPGGRKPIKKKQAEDKDVKDDDKTKKKQKK
ncbi:unnamed protein product [Urochloa decumbens]|uniref:Uncharacterized protein n=1 Tax=Urochloa decumbens TaxID=240449 RepID=A0ABC9GC08_9POAL